MEKFISFLNSLLEEDSSIKEENKERESYENYNILVKNFNTRLKA